MRERGSRRAVTVLAVVILLLLASAGGLALDRLRPGPGPSDVTAIDPTFTMLYEPPPPFDLPVDHSVRPLPAPRRNAAAPCPALPAVPARQATAAYPRGGSLAVYDAPDGRRVRALSNPTDENQRLTMLVRERRGEWVRAQFPIRPNHTTGWVRAADVVQYDVPYRIVVQLCAKKLTVFKAGKPVWTLSAAVGKPSTPTPLGSFFVDYVVPMRVGGSYGPYLLSVGGFSNVLHNFGGGIGQIGIHGTNRPALIGSAVSNGCVRLPNDAIYRLVKMVGPGTPVAIVA